MADERDEEQSGEPEGKSAAQQTTGQHEQNGIAQQRQEAGGIGSQQGMNPTDRGSSGEDSGTESGGSSGEGFIGSQRSGSDDYLQKDESSARERTGSSGTDVTSGSDFANQGRGALEEEEENEADDGSSSNGSGGGSF